MRFSLLITLFIIFLVPSHLLRAQGFDVIPPSGLWVTDLGDMMTSSEEQRLTQKLETYNDTTSTQIIVVTLPSLDGIPPADYAVELGRRWGVGQQGQDNGVVILASRNDRKLYIATGYGLEGAIPDIIASRIIQNVMVPSFRQGRFYEGFSLAADALIEAARGEFTALPQENIEGIDPEVLKVLIWIAIVVIILISRNRGSGGGRKHRRGNGFPVIIWGPSMGGSSWGGGGFGGGGFGGGGFSGGGGSFGGGGAGGSW